MWYMDLLGGMYDDPRIVDLVCRVRRVDERYLAADKRSNADIAVVVDEDSYGYLADGEVLPTALMTADPALRDYRLYLFLNTFRVTPEQRTAIQRRSKRNHATAVWIYAPGYIGEKLSVENMRALTGIRVVEERSVGELNVAVTSFQHPYTVSLAQGTTYGMNGEAIKRYFDHRLYLKDPSDPGLERDLPGFRVQPRFYGDDPQATVLGELAGAKRPGLLVKVEDGWTSVYSSAPILPAALLRNIARAAGCHVYTDAGDVVYANGNFLALYSPQGGTRSLRLPRVTRVMDLLGGNTVASATAEFLVKLPANTARVFALE